MLQKNYFNYNNQYILFYAVKFNGQVSNYMNYSVKICSINLVNNTFCKPFISYFGMIMASYGGVDLKYLSIHLQQSWEEQKKNKINQLLLTQSFRITGKLHFNKIHCDG